MFVPPSVWVTPDSFLSLQCRAPRPSSARAVPRSGVATDCPCCFAGGRLHRAPLLRVTRGLVCVHPLQPLSRAKTFAMTPATQNKRRLSRAARAHAARSTTWAFWLCRGVNTTQLNYFSLQRTTNPPPTPPPLFLYINRFACTFTPLFSLPFIFRSPRLIRGSWCRTQA